VHEIIALQRAKLVRAETSARFSAQIRREKEETKGSVTAFLSEVGAGSLRDYIRGISVLEDTKAQLLAHARGISVLEDTKAQLLAHASSCAQ